MYDTDVIGPTLTFNVDPKIHDMFVPSDLAQSEILASFLLPFHKSVYVGDTPEQAFHLYKKYSMCDTKLRKSRPSPGFHR